MSDDARIAPACGRLDGPPPDSAFTRATRARTQDIAQDTMLLPTLFPDAPAQAGPRPLIVSLHLPKTAGTSFAQALRGAFGDACRTEYVDQPMQYPRWNRRLRALAGALAAYRRLPPAPACVHGHFLPLKYRLATGRQPVRFITWLRDPVERIASHYHFWKRDYDGADPSQPLRNRMLAEDWCFERFALGPEMRDLYHEYLWRFDPARFDFIGITEHYADDLERFARQFGCSCSFVSRALVNPERGEDSYGIGGGLRARIEAHHARDVALYRWALARRDAGIA